MKKYQNILDLRPTQFSVGLYEIHIKVGEMAKMGKRERRKIVEEKPIPVVRTSEGELYILDHHHHLFVCWQAGIKKVPVEITQDFSRQKMGFGKFWRRMRKNGCAYLYDQFGDGPRSALYLPRDVRGLGDDPYRSMAWAVRHKGAYENSDKPFAEFEWANFFRSKKLLDKEGPAGFKAAVKKGVRHARSPAARKLPGYIPPSRRKDSRGSS
jgi:hypothetical protein